MRSKFFCPIHPEGYIFSLIFGCVAILLWHFWYPLGVLGLLLTIWCLYFFRDPERFVPQDSESIVSPADGRVCQIDTVAPPKELQLNAKTCIRVSIFMDVLNVHVNRSPISGKVVEMHYHEGKFLNASLDKASEENERQLLTVQNEHDIKIGVVQIAGLVARRIRSDVEINTPLEKGQRFGLIRFGSRVDVYLPHTLAPVVGIGQTMVAGETPIAFLHNTLPKPGDFKGV